MGQFYYALFISNDGAAVQIICTMRPDSLRLTEHSFLDNKSVMQVESLLCYMSNCQIVWAGDYADKEINSEENLYEMADKIQCVCMNGSFDSSAYPIIANHSKHLYVDKRQANEVHPLPILTVEGNGRGNGDYNGTHMELVGTWARDMLSMEQEPPADYVKLEVCFEEEQYY